ncbi:hypothetical protein M3Y96_01224400 [Aphelenchoides besseyi]|nr:hypothetical protein M3Y96_01224400 [Aphelenchoides besseyi]
MQPTKESNQICEYYRSDIIDPYINYYENFGGTWMCRFEHSSTRPFVEFADLFGHQKNEKFTLEPPIQLDRFYPLNEEIGLFQHDVAFEDDEKFFAAKLNWRNLTCAFGKTFCLSPDYDSTIIYDRAHSVANNNIYFLIKCQSEHTGVYCRLDVNELCITRVGATFTLSPNDFNCIDLNGDVISGLNESMTEIKRYNVQTRQFLDSFKVHGLPSTIRCLWKTQAFHQDLRQNLITAGAWTDDRLFVWSEERNIRSEISTIYCVHLHSGIATSTNYRFNDLIRRLFISPCGSHLYVRNDKLIERPHVGYMNVFRDVYKSPQLICRYFRIPLNNPESLFFLAAAALQRPIPQHLIRFVTRHREPIPLQVYK